MKSPESQTPQIQGKESRFKEIVTLPLSKRLREMLLFAALGVGGCGPDKPDAAEAPRPPKQYVEHKTEYSPVLELGPMAEKFEQHVLIEGKKHIVHLGQLHGADSLKESQEVLKEIIIAQKDIEELIIYLQRTAGLKRIYLEGLLTDEISFKLLSDFQKELQGYEAAQDYTRFFSRIYNLYTILEKNKTQSPEMEKFNGVWTFFLKEKLAHRLPEFKQQAQLYGQSPHQCKVHYRTLFENAERAGNKPNVIIGSYEKLLNALENDRLIAKDNIYVWGAALKLWAEGKLVIEPTSNKALDDIKHPLGKRLQRQKTYSEKDEQEYVDITNRCEDFALAQAQGGLEAHPEEQFQVIDYGARHDFYGNVTRANNTAQAAGREKVGFIVLTSPTTERFIKTVKDRLLPDISDEEK